jgi:integrase
VITHTSLRDWVDQYELSHEISESTAAHYRQSIHNAERFAGQPLTSATISDLVVNGALAAILKAGRSPEYARSVKSGVMAVWRDMADAGLVDYPRKIRPIRSRPKMPEVWTCEQIRTLLAAAGQISGRFRTVPLARADYWQTLIPMAWDSGLRRRDLHRMRRCDISEDFIWKQHKTRKLVRVRLRPSTLARIDAWGRPADAVLWPLWGSPPSWDAAWSKLVAAAAIPYGPFKRIRKSTGTAAEIIQPGAGHLVLGNTRAVFERNYLDSVRVVPPQPPELT